MQIPALAAAAADKGGPGGAGISKYVAPRALFWFRWAALATWLTGAWYLGALGQLRRRLHARHGERPGQLLPAHHRHRRLARHDHAVQRLGADLAEPEEGARHRRRHATRRRPRRARWRCWPRARISCCRCRCCCAWARPRTACRSEPRRSPRARDAAALSHPADLAGPRSLRALAEDVGSGDLTAALVPAIARGRATVITREAAVLCRAAVMSTRCSGSSIRACSSSGRPRTAMRSQPGQLLCRLRARRARCSPVSAPRSISCRRSPARPPRRGAMPTPRSGLPCRVLDTRKTHARACAARRNTPCAAAAAATTAWGSTTASWSRKTTSWPRARSPRPWPRRAPPGTSVPVEVEVETLDELRQALDAGADMALLDEFSLDGHARGGRAEPRASARAR